MPYTVTLPHVVGWGECDAAGLIFYPNYFNWFEEGTWNFFEQAGRATVDLMAQYGVVGFPLVSAKADFTAPCRYRQRVEIRSWVSQWRRSTLDMTHVVTRGDVKICTGVETRIWAHVDEQPVFKIRPAPFPEELRAHFRQLDAEVDAVG